MGGKAGLSQEGLESLLASAWEVRSANFPARIACHYPRRTVAVSVTGGACALNCAHCGGHYLRGMVPLAALAGSERAAGRAASYLISGGCDPRGRVPVAEHLDQIRALRTRGGPEGRAPRLNLHVGLVSEDEARIIGQVADCVSFDFVADAGVIRDVYGLNRAPADYLESYLALRRHTRVLPHICVGLGGVPGAELRALELLRQAGAETLVFLVFTPTPGTRHAARPVPPPGEVAAVLSRARLDFPRTPIYLGCMRPGGRHRELVDSLAVRAGVNAIVNPAPRAVETARGLGLEVDRGEECCVL